MYIQVKTSPAICDNNANCQKRMKILSKSKVVSQVFLIFWLNIPSLLVLWFLSFFPGEVTCLWRLTLWKVCLPRDGRTRVPIACQWLIKHTTVEAWLWARTAKHQCCATKQSPLYLLPSQRKRIDTVHKLQTTTNSLLCISSNQQRPLKTHGLLHAPTPHHLLFSI